MRTGIANFSLDWGHCPRWLFERMKRLARVCAVAIIESFGPEEFLRRLSDPVWFQSFGTVLAFDWNSSGITTTTMGALKEALRGIEKSLDIFICGGKGAVSRKTPREIARWGGGERLIYLSRLTAKVDSALIQDGFQIYHHNFIFTSKGHWTVIQQGMNISFQKARRYHWFGQSNINFNLIEEPHTGIASQLRQSQVLDLTSHKSRENRDISLELIHHSQTLYHDLKILQKGERQLKILTLPEKEFHTHPIVNQNIKNLISQKPTNFEKMLMVPKVGGRTIRALSLVAEVIYGAKPSYEDPARYSFAHGGKDGTPYPVDRKTYDQTLEIMEKALARSRLLEREKYQAMKRAEEVFLR